MTVIGCILAYFLAYGLVAFVNWEINAGEWGEIPRFFAAFAGTAGAFCWVGIRKAL